MDTLSTHIVAVDALRRLIADIFVAAGCEAIEAGRISFHLVSANITGHDSHGVIRTPRYIQWLREGKVLAGQILTVVTESPTHAVVDGNFGFGQTIGPLAVDMGIAKARLEGMSIIALRHSGHIGRIGDWAERAAKQGLVSIHFVNVSQGEIVAPFGGADRRFATNPMCVGVPPVANEPMLILDFATSMVAEGKVLVASNGGKPVPPGAMIEPDGTLSTDPATLYGPLTHGGARDLANGTGALCTFGAHKGSGIAFMCEILAGVLTGGGTSGPIAGGRRGRISNGMFSIYLDPGHFGANGFAAQAAEYARYVKASRPAIPGGEVLVPGEPEARNRSERLANGIPLQADTWLALQNVARDLGVALH